MNSDTLFFENSVFRYRSMDALFGKFEELERQTVYFASPEHLNDPMEGVRQIFWRGDRTTWRNLLRHYIICLHQRAVEAVLTEHSGHLPRDTVAVFQSLENFPTPQARSLCEECIALVEGGELHAAILDLLASASRDISFTELQQLLRTVHFDWLSTVRRNLGFSRVKGSQASDPSVLVHVLRTLQDTIPQIQDQLSPGGLEVIHRVQNHMAEQMTLLSAAENAHISNPKNESLLFEFTSDYLNSLLKLIYPPWYVACFSGRHDNAAMWSYYAANHRGCCLIFRKKQAEEGFTIRLNGPNGYGSNGVFRTTRGMPLEAVRYAAHQQRIEFFTNIGQMTVAATLSNWFRDDDGNTSPLAEYLKTEKMADWRDIYWKNFSPPLLHKLPDWQHESEFRIVVSDILGIHDTDEHRTFTYDYDTLDGIIFGINTSLSDKIRVLGVLDRKLKSRTVSEPFRVYQARYNAQSGRVEADHLSLIKHPRV